MKQVKNNQSFYYKYLTTQYCHVKNSAHSKKKKREKKKEK